MLTSGEKLYTNQLIGRFNPATWNPLAPAEDDPQVHMVREGEMMYEITITRSFAAAHVLKDIGGKCEGLHGHNFIVDVSLASDRVNKEGLLIDFRVLKEWTDEILEGLDHTYLNDHPYFKDVNPSAENLARFIHDKVRDKARSVTVIVSRVTVWESENARASYSGT